VCLLIVSVTAHHGNRFWFGNRSPRRGRPLHITSPECLAAFRSQAALLMGVDASFVVPFYGIKFIMLMRSVGSESGLGLELLEFTYFRRMRQGATWNKSKSRCPPHGMEVTSLNPSTWETVPRSQSWESRSTFNLFLGSVFVPLRCEMLLPYLTVFIKSYKSWHLRCGVPVPN
jgi:hypothetical protein